MKPKSGLMNYAKIGFRYWISGLISGAVLWVLMLILVFVGVLSDGTSFKALPFIILIIYLALSLVLTGFFANKLWKWS